MSEHITATDPRVQDLASELGMDPETVLSEATDAASEDGLSVGAELDGAEAEVQIMKAFNGTDGTDDVE